MPRPRPPRAGELTDGVGRLSGSRADLWTLPTRHSPAWTVKYASIFPRRATPGGWHKQQTSLLALGSGGRAGRGRVTRLPWAALSSAAGQVTGSSTGHQLLSPRQATPSWDLACARRAVNRWDDGGGGDGWRGQRRRRGRHRRRRDDEGGSSAAREVPVASTPIRRVPVPHGPAPAATR